MDKLSGFLSGGGNNQQGQQQQTSQQGGEDYLDKALDAAEKKFGGGKVNPEQARQINERVTDGAREAFEKATGKNVPSKFSN